jgi:hypothetical protein
VLTDEAAATGRSCGVTPGRARDHPETNPALPTADQRQDRTLPPHPGRRLGFKKLYNSENARRAALAEWLHEYNHQRPHTAIGGSEPITRWTNLTARYA